MLASGEEERDLPAFPGRNDAAGEHTRARIALRTFQFQHPHAGIVVVQHLALRRLPDQLIARGLQ